jgi:hypothetical protein
VPGNAAWGADALRQGTGKGSESNRFKKLPEEIWRMASVMSRVAAMGRLSGPFFKLN